MVFQYFVSTDMLYIELVRAVSTESEEVAPSIVLDYDENHRVIGIEIEDASKFVDLKQLEVSSLPLTEFVVRQAQDIDSSGLVEEPTAVAG